ncbi:hypothetical protein TNIN_338751 [Trichonephila inaurata madagascariensis]|uniref:Uncharacterized protein n=1 Tax=Trichonephila inaurata madagascariensis TaxID=2747483 RepID=A0A8X6YNS9_9ARAC|nr:hypothetical protein TNIN_338751 [Trichonephila inaurata madagascariensis]
MLVCSIVYAKWVTKHLSKQKKTERMSVCLIPLLRYTDQGTDILLIVTWNETLCHHFEPAFKRMNMERWHPGNLHPKRTGEHRKPEKRCSASLSKKTSAYQLITTDCKNRC